MENLSQKYLNIRKVTGMRMRSRIQEEAGSRILKPFISHDIVFEEHQYIKDQNSYHNCDFIYKEKDIKKPMIVYIHGGGWVCGAKEFRRGQLSIFASEGFFILSINYTLCPEAVFPTQIHEIYKAIEFAMQYKEEYNIDFENVFICGDSAGGHLAALASVCKNDEDLSKIVNYDFSEKFEFKAMACLCGIFDLRTVLKCKFPKMKKFMKAYGGNNIKKFLKSENAYIQSPINFPQSFPPTFLVMGEGDKLKRETEQILATLAENNKEIRLFVGRGVCSFHVFTIMFNAETSNRCLKEISAFFWQKIGNEEYKRKLDILANEAIVESINETLI